MALTSQHALSDIEFDVLCQLLSVFRENIDTMPLEQKRAAIRTVVRKVIWDGENAHIVLFGATDDEIEMPDLSKLVNAGEQEEAEPLEPFADVDYEDDLENAEDSEGEGMTPLCEDSERDPDVFPQSEEEQSGRIPVGVHRDRQRRGGAVADGRHQR